MTKRAKPKTIKPFELVRRNNRTADVKEGQPFTHRDTFIYLGETVQMPGHGTFVRFRDGKCFVNYHIEDFETIPRDEA